MLRLGLVGCGRLAEVGYVPAASGLADLELVAVADPDAARAEALAAALGPGVSAHRDAAALVAAAAPDGLIIASPPASHLADAEAAAGIPCLVEKPPAHDLAAAAALAALEPAPWIGFNRRFQHGAPLLGRIPGEPYELELEIRYRRASWRPHTGGDDALLDLAPHLVDLALLLSGAGEAAVRSATVARERATLELALGTGIATIRCATDRPYYERVAISAGGSVVASSTAGGPAKALLTRLPGIEHPLISSLRAQLAAFAEAVAGRDPGVLASADDGLRVMRVIDSVRVDP